MASHRVGMSQGGEEAQAGPVGSVPTAPQGGEALSLVLTGEQSPLAEEGATRQTRFEKGRIDKTKTLLGNRVLKPVSKNRTKASRAKLTTNIKSNGVTCQAGEHMTGKKLNALSLWLKKKVGVGGAVGGFFSVYNYTKQRKSAL